jgi:O-antigen/teichoic acid export membrane protein
MAGQFISSISGSVGFILNMTGKQNILQLTALISVVLNVTLNFMLIPMYGIGGAAISTAIAGILWNLLCVFYIFNKMGFTTMYIPFYEAK